MNIKELDLRIHERRSILTNSVRGRESAVVLPLVHMYETLSNDESRDDLGVLFTVRSSKLRTQPGEICFPGGGIDAGEEPAQAAEREVYEELLISPRHLKIIGEIDGTIGPSGAPMWAYLGELTEYDGTFSKDEVAETFVIPLKELLAMEPTIGHVAMKFIAEDGFPYDLIPGGKDYPWASRNQDMPFYEYEGRVIWGATARILYAFLERIR